MEDAEFAVIQLAQTTMRSELGKKTVCSEYAVWVEVGEGALCPRVWGQGRTRDSSVVAIFLLQAKSNWILCSRRE